MTHSPIIRYFTDTAESDLELLRIDMAFAYLERMGQVIFINSPTFWLWWDNQWSLIDKELEFTFQQLNLPHDRAKAMHGSRHRIDPLHRWPNEVAAEAMMEEVYTYCLTAKP